MGVGEAIFRGEKNTDGEFDIKQSRRFATIHHFRLCFGPHAIPFNATTLRFRFESKCFRLHVFGRMARRGGSVNIVYRLLALVSMAQIEPCVCGSVFDIKTLMVYNLIDRTTRTTVVTLHSQ